MFIPTQCLNINVLKCFSPLEHRGTHLVEPEKLCITVFEYVPNYCKTSEFPVSFLSCTLYVNDKE
jgi:hypothetical protein